MVVDIGYLKTHPKVSSGSNDVVIRSSKKISKAIGKNLYPEVIRVISAVFPILKEFEPLSQPLYVASDIHYLFSCVCDLSKSSDLKSFSKELLITALAVAYLVFTILENDLGDKISTVEDMVFNVYGMVEAVSHRDYTELFEKIFNIVNDAVWLASYYYCYPEVEALSYGIDLLSHLYYAGKDWKKDKKLECISGLFMAGIRTSNVLSYFPLVKTKPPVVEEPKEPKESKKPPKLIVKDF